MKTINEFIEDYKNYMYAIKNYSGEYVSNILTTLKQFLSFMNIYKFDNKYNEIEDMELNDIRRLANSDIYSFIYYLAENKLKNNSRLVKINHLKTFFEYLYTIKTTLFKEPFKQISQEKKIQKRLPKYLSLEEALKVMQVHNNQTSLSIRNRAIISLFLNCGLRRAELINLQIDNIRLDNSSFTVIGKGNKERTCYLNATTKRDLEKYLEIRKLFIQDEKTKKIAKTVFFNPVNYKPLHRNTIEKLVKQTYKKAGLNPDKYDVHTLRHTCATLMFKNGTDIHTIQEVLGHARIETTEIYTHTYDKEVKDTMLQHPMSNFKINDALAYAN